MNLGQRSTFGAKSTEVKKETEKRQEFGAVWKRQSKSSNMNFLSLKIKLTKEKLQSLLAQAGESVDIRLIAFPNDSKGTDDSRPDFRIYEEKD